MTYVHEVNRTWHYWILTYPVHYLHCPKAVSSLNRGDYKCMASRQTGLACGDGSDVWLSGNNGKVLQVVTGKVTMSRVRDQESDVC